MRFGLGRCAGGTVIAVCVGYSSAKNGKVESSFYVDFRGAAGYAG